MKIFLSHASEDKAIVDSFINSLNDIVQNAEIDYFYTSRYETAISAGHNIISEVSNSLKTADLVVIFATDNYLRSTYCWYELSVSTFLGKQLIPICFSQTSQDEIKRLIGNNTVFLDAQNEGLSQRLYVSLLGALKSHKIDISMSQVKNGEEVFAFPLSETTKSYIGSGETYANIIKYCEDFGVKRFISTSLRGKELAEKLSNSKEIKIASTTAYNLTFILSEQILPQLLANGTNVTILIPNKYSQFCKDVALIETPDEFESNYKRLASEFQSVVSLLKQALITAKRINSESVGKIYFGCCSTLLRQTITLSIKNDDTTWGWVAMTIPPSKTIDGTPCFEFVSNTPTEEKKLFPLFNKHFDGMLAVAKRRDNIVEITDDIDIDDFCFYLEKDSALSYWKEKENTAKSLMSDRMDDYETPHILIEVAAQHPLRADGTPNEEFAKRLNKAVEIYNKNDNVKIYVPGSRHKKANVYGAERVDVCSLSCAGKKYLIGKGVKEEDIFADEMNDEYKGDNGVYNSADECYVAAQIFKNGDFSRLICICAPFQCLKKAFFYCNEGILPIFETVSSEKMFHNFIEEAINVLPYTIYEDHNWQDKNSRLGKKSRAERKPQSI